MAGIVERVKDYEYSSWGEYEGTVDPVFQICNTQTVLNRIPFTELETWVNEPLSDDIHCLDIEDPSRKRPSDDQEEQGASHRQLERLTGVGRGLIQKL